MPINTYPLKKEMTFSTKKVLLELVHILYNGEPSLVIHDYGSTKDGRLPYRQLDLCANGKVVATGTHQHELFEQVKAELNNRLKNKNYKK